MFDQALLPVTLRLLGVYWLVGCLMAAIQFASMTDSSLVFFSFVAAGFMLLGAHELLRWGLMRLGGLGKVGVIVYGLILMIPQIERLFSGSGRAWDTWALAMLGWLLIAMAVYHVPSEVEKKTEEQAALAG